MSKSGSIRSNPFVTGPKTIEKDLEQWNQSIKAEDCPLPDSDWSGGGHFRSRQIGFEPAPQNEDTANLALDASTRAAWVQCALLVREYDKGIIGKWHRNLDTWLVFAALFSAVITALLVESSGIPNVDENPRSRIIIVNSFWVCSLILSLNSVMLTILVKQWLAEYTWDVGTAVLSPEQTFTLRQMRFAVLQKWRVPTIIDYLPLQLLAALVLFYGGLITFLTTMHPVVAGLGISLTAVSVVIFVLTTAIPAVWPTAPYQSPQAWLSYRLSNSIRSLFSPSSRAHERPALKGWVDHGVQLIKSRKDGKFHEEGLFGVKTLIMLFAQYIPSSILDSDDPKDGFDFVPKLGEMLSKATFLRVYTTLHEYFSQFLDSDKPVVDPIPGDQLQDGVRVLLVLVRHPWIRTEQAMDGWTLLVALLRSTHFSGSAAQAIITRRILTNFLEDALKHEVDGRVQGRGITRLWPVQAFDRETEDELSWVLLTSSTLFVLINEYWADRDLGLNADEILNCWNCMIQYLNREVKNEETMEKAVKHWMRVLSPSRDQPRGVMKMLLREERISENFHIRFRELLEALDTASTPIPALYDLKGANWTLRLLNAFNAQEILDVFANTNEVASGGYSKEPEGSVSLSSRIRGVNAQGLNKVERIILTELPMSPSNDAHSNSRSYEHIQAACLLFHITADIEGDVSLHPDRYGRLLQLLTNGDDAISQLENGQQSALEMALAAIFHRSVQSWLQSMPPTDEDLRDLVFQATFEQCTRDKARLGVVLPLIALSLYAILTPMPDSPAMSQEESVKVLETATTFFETRVLEIKELPRTLMIQCINVVYWLSDRVELPDPLVQEMLGRLFQVIHDRYVSEATWDRSSRERLERILMQLQNAGL
ncbi:hypothetical protein H1R20_g10028, partial [Candolleomyces eurysporus]